MNARQVALTVRILLTSAAHRLRLCCDTSRHRAAARANGNQRSCSVQRHSAAAHRYTHSTDGYAGANPGTDRAAHPYYRCPCPPDLGARRPSLSSPAADSASSLKSRSAT